MPEAKTRRKTVAKKKPSSASAIADVPIGDIDTSPADAVRAGRGEHVVADYAESIKAGVKLPEPEVYRYTPEEGGAIYLLADGGYRVRAAKECGKKKIACLVHECESKEEAESRAYAHAGGANASHGQARSFPDRWAAVEALIIRPEYQSTPDRELAEICRVSHPLIRKVREKLTFDGRLTGKASATGRYKDSGSGYAKRMSAEDVGSAATAEPASEPIPPAAEPVTHTESAPDCDDGTTGDPVGYAVPTDWRIALVADRIDIDAATARTLRLSGIKTLGQLQDKLLSGERIGQGISDVARESLLDQLAMIVPPEIDDGLDELLNADSSQPVISRAIDTPEESEPAAKTVVVSDEKGRPVPENLLPVFVGRKWFRQYSQWVATAIKDVELTHAEQPFGAALSVGAIRTDAGNLSKAVAGAMPYVVCPSCDGEGMQGKTVCPVCSNKGDTAGRGWLSRMRHMQLTPELKRVCEGWGKPVA